MHRYNTKMSVEQLYHDHMLQLQALTNEYTMSLARINSDFAMKLRELTYASPLQPQEPLLKARIEHERSSNVKRTPEEYAKEVERLNNPSTVQYENNPGIKASSKNVAAIAQKIVETPEEEVEQSKQKRMEIQRLSLLLEGEGFAKAVEKLEQEGKELWIYQVNSSIHTNPPSDENPNKVIVKVIDGDFDFTAFKPSDKCIISNVVGVGVLGGL